jgi:hypothetical protein
LYGDLTLKRTYYQNKETKEYFFLLDNLLSWEKYSRMTLGYTLSGMDRDSMPDFFIQKRGHLLSPRYTINSPQKS